MLKQQLPTFFVYLWITSVLHFVDHLSFAHSTAQAVLSAAMALRGVYERFLHSPTPSSLSESASLHYVTTATTFSQSGPIVRHLDTQSRTVVKKKSENVVDAVEGHHSIVLVVDTTLEFLSSGGAYLPGLENFVTDKIATIPIVRCLP